jgi:hypothetical protein
VKKSYKEVRQKRFIRAREAKVLQQMAAIAEMMDEQPNHGEMK